MTYFFAYDITDHHRRNRVVKKLEQFGLRVQKSFFQCDVSSSMADEIKNALFHEIDEQEDSLFLYPLCSDCLAKTRLLGSGTLLQDSNFEIL
jgi:CRISPR-associated protein Cas2